MASPSYAPRRVDDHKIVLEPGVPQVFALKQPANGRPVGQYGSIMYTSVDERKLFVVKDEASDFHHAMIDMRIQPAEFIKCTRIQHGKGSGFTIRVERVPDASDPPAWVKADPPTRMEALLEKSVEMARTTRAPVAAPTEAAARTQNGSDPAVPTSHQSNGTDSTRITPAASKLCACLMAAVDAAVECETYAKRKGLELRFSSEDIRTMANTLAMNGGAR
jgi:hypothetical protein